MGKIRIVSFFLWLVLVGGGVYGGDKAITNGEGGTSESKYEDVFVQGDYAYCAALYGGLDIIDIRSVENPVKIGNYDTWTFERAAVYSVVVKGKYAYATYDEGLMIIDISNPVFPSPVGRYYTDINCLPMDVEVKDNYAYIVLGCGGLHVIDITDPVSPTLKGKYITYWANGVYVKDNYAYVTDNQSGLMIFDVSDPSSIKLAGTWAYPEPGIDGVYVRDNYAYVANGYKGLDIVDVSNPASPRWVGNYNTPGAARNALVRGNYAYAADYHMGLMIIDVSQPSFPQLTGSYDTIGTAWGGLFLRDNFAFVADFDHGLQIIDVSSPSSPTWVGSYDPSYSKLSLSRGYMNFGAERFGKSTGSQTLLINNIGGGTLNWDIDQDQNWLHCTPTAGTDAGSVTVSVDATGLSAGTYYGKITVSASDAIDSPQTVSVTLNVYGMDQTSGPFGSFDTPIDGTTVCGSVPFTGWVLDDIGVEGVKLYRQEGNTLLYIGDSLLVEGARPDIETLYSQYPNDYKAGWGYMMLTNFLPNGGNGTFTIHAIATDINGNRVTLGTKIITVDNANAVRPFGAIDTPTQGGEAKGTNYLNIGWALTPQPAAIPQDGTTIKVWVDGVPQTGNPVYNRYREDIAELFPGNNNSGGAGAYFYLDTTRYANGVHTISWIVADNEGNADGIGSRYFNILNPKGSATPTQEGPTGHLSTLLLERRGFPGFPADIPGIPVADADPVQIIKGADDSQPRDIYPDEKDVINIEIKELERIEVHFPASTLRYSRLPIGSFLDTEKGIFYWQPGPGFLGEHDFVFLEREEKGDFRKKYIKIVIKPRFSDRTLQ